MEKYKILDKEIKHLISNNKKSYSYLVKAECNDCGNIRWVNPANPYFKKGICRNCNEISYRNEVLKIENENFKVLSIDEEGTKKNTRHTRYFVQCKKCGKVFSRRASVIRTSLNSIQCSNCRRNRNGKSLNTLQYKAYCYYKSSAIKRDLEWNLSEEQFKKLIQGNCKYCNNTPSKKQTVSYKDTFELINGIDRINSSKGYTIENCVSCCTRCNIMKSDMTLSDFKEHISKIYKYIFQRSTTISKGSTLQANGNGNGGTLNT